MYNLMERHRIAVINGSLGGKSGNTGRILALLLEMLISGSELREIHLSPGFPNPRGLEETLAWAQGFVFASGTYWDSWGSPLQRFFEETTDFEAGEHWLGKPACTLVTMHSVGGKEVLSRLQGVLSTLGCQIPPMSGMIYSLANHLALRGQPSEFHADLWQLGDLGVLAHNLVTALEKRTDWKAWPVDTSDPKRRWFFN